MHQNLDELCELLEIGARRFEALGDRIVASDFDTADNITKFIRDQIQAIRKGNTDSTNLYKLWAIFAPTCEWDDFVGDVALGDEIFTAVNQFFTPEPRKK